MSEGDRRVTAPQPPTETVHPGGGPLELRKYTTHKPQGVHEIYRHEALPSPRLLSSKELGGIEHCPQVIPTVSITG